MTFKHILRNSLLYIALPSLLGWLTFYHLPETTDVTQQSSTLASVAATLLGFIIAAVAVIVSVDNQTLIKNLKRYGYYDSLIKDMMLSGFFMSLTTIMAFAVGFLPKPLQVHGITVSIVLTTIAFVAFAEACYKLWLIMKVLAQHTDN